MIIMIIIIRMMTIMIRLQDHYQLYYLNQQMRDKRRDDDLSLYDAYHRKQR